MNSIQIAGNVTADAETRYLPDGKPVVSFSVADNRGRDKPAIFWRCSWFGERAEKVAAYILKGGSVTVVGSVQEEEWTDKDGNPRKGMKVLVNDVALQGGRQQESTQEPRQQRPAPTPAARPQAQRTAPAGSTGSGFDDLDDSIPF